jgi:hypothetical protein
MPMKDFFWQKSEAAAAAGKEILSQSEVRRRMRAWAAAVEAVLGAIELSKAPAEQVDAIRRPAL